MKNISFTLLLAGLLFSIKLEGQCPCFELIVNQNANNLCQMDIAVVRLDSCPGVNLTNQVTMTLTNTTSQITSALAGMAVSVNLNATQTVAVFTTDFNLSALPLNTSTPIGSMFLASTTLAQFNGKISAPPPAGDVCTFAGFSFNVPCNVFNVTTFEKLYGNTHENIPLKVKGFNNSVYVLGQLNDGMNKYATFSKFTMAGGLIWQHRLNFPSILNDFEYTGVNDNSFLLVGASEPTGGSPTPDNHSLLVKIDNSGNLLLSEHYYHTGHEGFTRIARHTNPLDALFPFYVTGAKNENLPASTIDQMMIYNFDKDGIAAWAKEYLYPFELESFRGIFPTSDGHVVVVGNGSPNNPGILIKVDGATGATISSNAYGPALIDFYDGMELPSGEIVVAGTDFGNGKAILLKLSSTFAPLYGITYNNVSIFQEMGRDAQGRFYAIGPETVSGKQFPVVLRILDNGGPPIPFSGDYGYYLDDGETAFKNPHFSVTPAANRIFFADSRLNNPLTFGNYDLLVGAFDLELNNPCRVTFGFSAQYFIATPTSITVTDQNVVQVISPDGTLIPMDYGCHVFCSPPGICTAAFTWTLGTCLDVNFSGTGTSSGSGPLVYSWTINPGAASLSGQNPTWTTPTPGTYNVCLTVSDASVGCSATTCQNVIVPAAAAPACVIPSNIFVNTDPGHCYAFLSPMVSGTGCPPVTVSVVLSGATTGTVLATNYNKGVTTVTVTVTDGLNQSITCTFTVTVTDSEPPVIVCPQNISATVPACNGGSIINYPAPTVTDNCLMPTYICSHPSGSFFPCGQTVVTCTATDMSQNTSSPCTFTVNIACQCASTGIPTITCDPLIDDKYLFTIPVTILNGATNCTVCVSGTGQPGVTVSAPCISGSGVLSGTITVTGGVIPNPTFNLVVTVQCICPNGQASTCTLPVSIVPVCCKRISLANQSVCATAQTALVPITGCGQFSCVQRLDYWVASGLNCPVFPGPGWSVQQSSTNCASLLLLPYKYTHNIWVKAILDVCDYPCSIVESNIVCITLCQPVSCTVSPSPQEYCYTGAPITPNLLTVNYLNGTGCPSASVTWSGPPGTATGDDFQPDPVSASSAPLPCYEDFIYTAHVQTICGTQTCSATVRLFKDNADIGDLAMNPNEQQPFCPGEDATVEFDPGCVSHPPAPGMWDWCFSTVSPGTAGYVPLIGSGNMNPLWNTNQLYVDTWYKVKASNGVCAQKEVVYFIDVRDPFSITNFTVTPVAPPPGCVTTALNLSVSFSPTPATPLCPIKVCWIKNGVVLVCTTYTTASSPATLFYTAPGDYSGNYWVTVERVCCNEKIKSNIVTIAPPCYATMTGPCFRCNNEAITLCGAVFNVPNGVTCTYQWFNNIVGPISGATGLCITVYQANVTYTFQATCGGCIKTVSYFLKQCGSGPFLHLFYKDFDADSFGNADSSLLANDLPMGYVDDDTDCNDMNPAIHPGATEICNSIDDDCNGSAESLTTTWTGLGDNLNWSDADNWSDGFVPLTCQHVVLPANKIVKVATGVNAVGKTLDVPVTTQLTVEVTGTLIIQN